MEFGPTLHLSDEEPVYSLFLFLFYLVYLVLIAYQTFKCVLCWLRSRNATRYYDNHSPARDAVERTLQ